MLNTLERRVGQNEFHNTTSVESFEEAEDTMANSIVLLIQQKVGKKRLFYFISKAMRKAAGTNNENFLSLVRFPCFFFNSGNTVTGLTWIGFERIH